MLYQHWNAQELPGASPLDPTRALKRAPRHHAQSSRELRASIFCTLCKRFLINGAPSHPLPAGTLEQSYATAYKAMHGLWKKKSIMLPSGTNPSKKKAPNLVRLGVFEMQPYFWYKINWKKMCIFQPTNPNYLQTPFRASQQFLFFNCCRNSFDT